jgi:hypothetical protein
MRSLCAALVVIAMLALAACGGSSSKSPATATATATATSTTPGKPSRLAQTDLDRLDRAVKALLSTTPLFQSKLNRCVPARRRESCVKRAARPAEAAVNRSRKTIDASAAKTGGPCSTVIQAVADRLDTLTQDLRAVTLAANSKDVGTFTKVGAQIQGDLRVLAAAGQEAQTTCAG